MRDNNLSVQYVRLMAHHIINDPRHMVYEKRYGIGVLIAPTIVKKYKENGAQVLKKYLEEAKNENLDGALEAIGIEKNEQGIRELISNFQQHMQSLYLEER